MKQPGFEIKLLLAKEQISLFGFAIDTERKHVREFEIFFTGLARRTKDPTKKLLFELRSRDYMNWGSALVWCKMIFRKSLRCSAREVRKQRQKFKVFLLKNKPKNKIKF